MISSASRYGQSLYEAPASVTVISRDEIRRFGYRTLAEVLSAAVGLLTTYDRNYTYLTVGRGPVVPEKLRDRPGLAGRNPRRLRPRRVRDRLGVHEPRTGPLLPAGRTSRPPPTTRSSATRGRRPPTAGLVPGLEVHYLGARPTLAGDEADSCTLAGLVLQARPQPESRLELLARGGTSSAHGTSTPEPKSTRRTSCEGRTHGWVSVRFRF